MSKRIKDEIAAFKRQNGNSDFTTKEMLWYVMSKIDTVNEKLEKGSGKIASNRTTIEGLEKSDSRLWKIVIGSAAFIIVFLINLLRGWFG